MRHCVFACVRGAYISIVVFSCLKQRQFLFAISSSKMWDFFTRLFVMFVDRFSIISLCLFVGFLLLFFDRFYNF